jgi:deoxyribodipyrimidine photolyase-related protein
MATKPYCASGKYIKRMSNYCRDCRFDAAARTGDGACPFTVLYWDFLLRHVSRLDDNPRMALQLRNLASLDADEKKAFRTRADALRKEHAT